MKKILKNLKNFTTVSILSILSIWFAGCTKYNIYNIDEPSDDEPLGNEEPAIHDNIEDVLVGTWISDNNEAISFTFNSNHEGYSIWNGYHKNEFKWTLDESSNLSIKHKTFQDADQEGILQMISVNKMKWRNYTCTRKGSYVNPDKPGGDNDSKDWAPHALTGKIIEFSEFNSQNQSLCGSRYQFYTDHDMRCNDATDDSSYTYTKISSTSAKLNFIFSQRGPGFVRIFRYNLTMTFTSTEEFSIEGTKEVNGGIRGNGTYKIHGHGGYVDSLY